MWLSTVLGRPRGLLSVFYSYDSTDSTASTAGCLAFDYRAPRLHTTHTFYNIQSISDGYPIGGLNIEYLDTVLLLRV
jgi:hypothetical protein